jgi:hypothetical protein
MNNLDNPSADFTYRVMMGGLKFQLSYYDLGPTMVKRMIDEQAEFPFLTAEYKWRELGKTEAWYRTQCRELLNNKTKIKRELDLVWPLSGEGSVFDEDELDTLRTHERPVVAVMPINLRHEGAPANLEIHWAEQPDVRVPYVVGVDTASGEGRDNTAFVFCHPYDMRAVGYLKTNTTNTESLREVAKHILKVLFTRAIAVVERNYLGVALINYLIKDASLEARLFYLKKVKVAQRTLGKSGRSLSMRTPVREYGVTTDASSREEMIRHLFQIVEQLPHLMPLKAIQDDIRTLQRKKSGKVEHRSGFHDDVLFAFLMVQYADRHSQPVLRELIARSGGVGRAEASMRVAALNEMEGVIQVRPAAAADFAPAGSDEAAGVTTVSTSDYVERDNARAAEPDAAARRRRETVDMINALNTGSGGRYPV